MATKSLDNIKDQDIGFGKTAANEDDRMTNATAASMNDDGFHKGRLV